MYLPYPGDTTHMVEKQNEIIREIVKKSYSLIKRTRLKLRISLRDFSAKSKLSWD